MEKLTIYKNKGETFKCNFKIEGAEPDDTIIRLCLEFEDNPNYFFYGKLAKNGDCTIEIPRLKHLDEEEGKLTVEAIADSVYFQVYEAEVEAFRQLEREFVQVRDAAEARAIQQQLDLEALEEKQARLENKLRLLLKKHLP